MVGIFISSIYNEDSSAGRYIRLNEDYTLGELEPQIRNSDFMGQDQLLITVQVHYILKTNDRRLLTA